LFFVKDFENTGYWINNFALIYQHAKKMNRLVYIVTPEMAAANEFFNLKNKYHIPVFSLDATAFKTAARTNPELYLMKGPVIKNKWGWADLKDALEK
jgi:vacuolar-type H+-ATPase subunit B/Vma2